jgi:opacity protein-like surface antigen
MFGTTARVLAVAGALALSASPMLAQARGTMDESGRPLRLGGMLGATLPLGDFGDVAEAGFHIGALGEFAQPTWPFALRGEITYHRNGAKDFDGNASVLSFVPNIVFPFGDPAATARPYIIGGVGIHRVSVDIEVPGFPDAEESETKFGFNVGGGFNFNLAGFDTFIEARFHSVLTSESSTNFIPLSFGFKF